MSFTCEMSDYVSRIRVAQANKDLTVNVRLTKMTLQLSALFYRNGLIRSFFVLNSQKLILRLKYQRTLPFLAELTVLSTPGRRVYWNLKQLARATNRQAANHMFVLSTPRGLCTGVECLVAPQRRFGGEVLLVIRLNS